MPKTPGKPFWLYIYKTNDIQQYLGQTVDVKHTFSNYSRKILFSQKRLIIVAGQHIENSFGDVWVRDRESN
jgi:hypothetical protein